MGDDPSSQFGPRDPDLRSFFDMQVSHLTSTCDSEPKTSLFNGNYDWKVISQEATDFESWSRMDSFSLPCLSFPHHDVFACHRNPLQNFKAQRDSLELVFFCLQAIFKHLFISWFLQPFKEEKDFEIHLDIALYQGSKKEIVPGKSFRRLTIVTLD